MHLESFFSSEKNEFSFKVQKGPSVWSQIP